MKRILLAIGLAFAAASQAVAQTPQTVRICNGSQSNCPAVSVSNPLPVTGSGGGSVTQGTSPWVDNITQWASVALGAPSAYGSPPGAVNVPGVNAFVTNTNNNGAATSANSSPVVLATDSVDVCFRNAKTNLPISFQTTALTQQIAASGSNKIYICSAFLVASAATVFSVTGGTGTNCGTGTAAIIGATSATHGVSLAANGGFTLGNGTGTVAVTAASSELCLVQSGAGDLVGNLTYVQAP